MTWSCPFIRGYKPRSNAQLLLRQAVQQFVLNQPGLVSRVWWMRWRSRRLLSRVFMPAWLNRLRWRQWRS